MEYYKNKLKNILSEHRYSHSIRVMNTCENLAKHYNQDINKAKIAGLLHDCAREKSTKESFAILEKENIEISLVEMSRPILLHAKVSSIFAKTEFGINDYDILNAIACHTTGKIEMSIYDQILYISDYIEPLRKFQDVDVIRNLAYTDIRNTLLSILKSTIIHVTEQGNFLHPDTVDAYNCELYKKNK